MTLEELEIVVKANVEQATKDLGNLKAKMSEATEKGFEQISMNSEKMGEAVAKSSETIKKMSPQLAQMTTKAITGSSAMASLSKTAVATSTALKSAFPVILAISLALLVIIKAIQSLKNKIDNTIKVIKQTLVKTLEFILKLLQRIGYYATRLMGIFSNLARKGMANLVQASNELNTALSQIQGKTIQLGNALATAVAPVIQALTPLIVSMLNALINVANMIGEITASLFGNATVYKKATNVTTNYAKALGTANKEQQKMLAGFDELNVLSDKQNDGGIGTAVADMFEPTEIRKEIQDLTKKIKDTFQEVKLKIEAGDFHGAGDVIGKAFNEEIDKLPTYEWGQNIAEKINHSLELVNGFLENKPAGTIGRKLGQFVAGWINAISPVEIGKAIANLINNAFAFVGEFFGSIAKDDGFKKLGEKLATNLIALIEGLDSQEIAEAINTVVISLLDLAIAFFKTWNEQGGTIKLITKVKELLDGIDWNEILPRVIEAIKQGWLAIESVKLGLRLLILAEIVGWILGALRNAIVGAVESIWTALALGFEIKISEFKAKLTRIQLILTAFKIAILTDVGQAFEKMKTTFKTGLRNLFILIVDGINKLIDKLNKFHFQLPEWAGGHEFGFNIKRLNYPELANGGVLTKPTPVIAGEYVGARQNPEIVAPQSILLETSTKANIPVMNAVEEMGDKLVEALNNVGVYAEFDYSKLKVGLDNENYRVGAKLYGI